MSDLRLITRPAMFGVKYEVTGDCFICRHPAEVHNSVGCQGRMVGGIIASDGKSSGTIGEIGCNCHVEHSMLVCYARNNAK